MVTRDAATTVYLIQWHRWSDVFDAEEDERKVLNDMLGGEMGAASVQDATSSTRPLTEKALCMKELDDNLDGILDDNYFSQATSSSAAARTPLGAVSNASTRGSDVPTTTIPSSTPKSEPNPAIDGSTTLSPGSSADPSLILVDSADTSTTDGSFQQVNPQDIDGASDTTTSGSKDTTTAGNDAPKAAGLKHKVRRSWGWLTGSSS